MKKGKIIRKNEVAAVVVRVTKKGKSRAEAIPILAAADVADTGDAIADRADTGRATSTVRANTPTAARTVLKATSLKWTAVTTIR